jgi:hypothetical protein
VTIGLSSDGANFKVGILDSYASSNLDLATSNVMAAQDSDFMQSKSFDSCF